MKKPYVICHMMASIDGRIDCAMTEQIEGNSYYEALEALNLDAKTIIVVGFPRFRITAV